MRGNIRNLTYKKSIRVLYGANGCYTICDDKIKFYPNLGSLKQEVDVDIRPKYYGNDYWGAINPSNERQYGYIENNVLYFTNRFGLPTGDTFNCYQINKFLNLKTFESEIKSGELRNLGLTFHTEQLPNEQSKIDFLYGMVTRLNKQFQKDEQLRFYNVKLEMRKNGEFENSEVVGNRNIEQEVGGKFTPFIRLWVNNGIHTGMMKFHYFLGGMNVSIYRKMMRLGKFKELLEHYKVTEESDVNKTLFYLEDKLKKENKIGVNDKLKLQDGIVSYYMVESLFPLLSRRVFTDFMTQKVVELINQVNDVKYNYFIPENVVIGRQDSENNPRSYDVFGEADFGQVATVKVVDSYACRESTIRFVTDLDTDYMKSFEELKYDFLNGNINICVAHYNDLINPDTYFRKHIDNVKDESNKRLAGKDKATQMDVKDKFYTCSVGMPRIMECTHDMSPKAFVNAAMVDEWNYLNDNIVTVRDVKCELRNFDNRNTENIQYGNLPCIKVGLNIDEFSVDYGEIIEVYLINRRTGMYKACVLHTPRVAGTSVYCPVRKHTSPSRAVGGTKPVNII